MKRPSKALVAKWYAKLAKAGFQDAEQQFDNGELMLKQWATSWQYRTSPTEYLERQAYYQRASDFLHTHNFVSKLEREIWQLYADGISQKQISEQLKLSKGMVNSALRRLRKACYGSKYPSISGIR